VRKYSTKVKERLPLIIHCKCPCYCQSACSQLHIVSGCLAKRGFQ
jgi:hypothetical protein